MNQNEILEVLEKKGALLTGHFVLSSGRHSDRFVQKFRAFEDPRLTQRFGELIADEFDADFDVVASPAVGALVLGFATALSNGSRFVFAERVDDRLVFRRGFELGARERTVVVEDVITTGASARAVVELVRSSGAEVVGVGALIERGDPARSSVDVGAQLRALARIEFASWEPDECPLCRNDEDIEDPGSRRTSP